MSRRNRKQRKEPKRRKEGKRIQRGKCRRCGCTEDHACTVIHEDKSGGSFGGCSWVDGSRTRCNACFQRIDLPDAGGATHPVYLELERDDLQEMRHAHSC